MVQCSPNLGRYLLVIQLTKLLIENFKLYVLYVLCFMLNLSQILFANIQFFVEFYHDKLHIYNFSCYTIHKTINTLAKKLNMKKFEMESERNMQSDQLLQPTFLCNWRFSWIIIQSKWNDTVSLLLFNQLRTTLISILNISQIYFNDIQHT